MRDILFAGLLKFEHSGIWTRCFAEYIFEQSFDSKLTGLFVLVGSIWKKKFFFSWHYQSN